jgi:hypothetical protein
MIRESSHLLKITHSIYGFRWREPHHLRDGVVLVNIFKTLKEE